MAAFGEDVAAVVNELDLDQVVFVGHSMGASVVVEAAKRISDQVIGVVAVDEFLDLDYSASLSPADIEAFLAPFSDDFPGTTREFVSTDMFVPESDPDLVNWILDDVSSAPAHVGIEAGKNLFLYESGDLHQALGEIQVPIRAIHSDMKPTNVEALERYGIEVVLMSGVGHFLTMEDPETFNALISEAISDFVG
jgi:pimeloyl-ACP methyl ester carboxylesterase